MGEEVLKAFIYNCTKECFCNNQHQIFTKMKIFLSVQNGKNSKEVVSHLSKMRILEIWASFALSLIFWLFKTTFLSPEKAHRKKEKEEKKSPKALIKHYIWQSRQLVKIGASLAKWHWELSEMLAVFMLEKSFMWAIICSHSLEGLFLLHISPSWHLISQHTWTPAKWAGRLSTIFRTI